MPRVKPAAGAEEQQGALSMSSCRARPGNPVRRRVKSSTVTEWLPWSSHGMTTCRKTEGSLTPRRRAPAAVGRVRNAGRPVAGSKPAARAVRAEGFAGDCSVAATARPALAATAVPSPPACARRPVRVMAARLVRSPPLLPAFRDREPASVFAGRSAPAVMPSGSCSDRNAHAASASRCRAGRRAPRRCRRRSRCPPRRRAPCGRSGARSSPACSAVRSSRHA